MMDSTVKSQRLVCTRIKTRAHHAPQMTAQAVEGNVGTLITSIATVANIKTKAHMDMIKVQLQGPLMSKS